MGSLSDYAEKKVLELLVGKTAFATPTCYVALSTADPLDDGSGMAEPGSNYARVATAGADWEAAVLGAGTIQNANALTFVEATGSWGTPRWFVLLDAASNKLGYGSLATKACTMAATGDVVTCTGHGFVVNDPIFFATGVGGVTGGTIYYVKTVPNADTFTFSVTPGGATFDITADGSNKVGAAKTIGAGDTPRFAAGDLDLTLD